MVRYDVLETLPTLGITGLVLILSLVYLVTTQYDSQFAIPPSELIYVYASHSSTLTSLARYIVSHINRSLFWAMSMLSL
jgi:uncharacterized membrane protein